MKYKNAQLILPDALVKELQSYVQGEYIYVPVEQEQQKRWGEVSGYRKELEQRNQKIKQEYQSGISADPEDYGADGKTGNQRPGGQFLVDHGPLRFRHTGALRSGQRSGKFFYPHGGGSPWAVWDYGQRGDAGADPDQAQ